MKLSVAVILAVAEAALAQQSAWAQCGGQGWTGGTTCISGYVCSKQGDYYSQCIPGTAGTTTAATSTTLATSTRGTTTATSATGVTTTRTGTTPAATTTAAASGNIFAGKQIYANPYYASEILSIAVPSLPSSLRAQASAVAKVGSFVWLDTRAKVPTMDTYLADIKRQNAAGANPPIMGAFVVYDLPDRDCAALASNGEYSIANGGVANYRAYIDAIAAIIAKYSDVSIALVIEPDSLANLVTNLNVAKCSGAQTAYKDGVAYAISTLNFKNVAMYIDGGHSGWLGWEANRQPAVNLFSEIYKSAGSPSQVRGLAFNVANYNAWSLQTCPSYTSPNPVCDEQKYANVMAPLLSAAGFPNHFIVDTGRNGVQPTSQQQQGDWCNVINTGFGVRPTTNTGNQYTDAFVWVKPGGESDGTSDSSATRYDAHCGYSDALKPAPEAGTWFQVSII